MHQQIKKEWNKNKKWMWTKKETEIKWMKKRKKEQIINKWEMKEWENLEEYVKERENKYKNNVK